MTSSVDSSPTLNRYCASHGPFDSNAVLSVLNQALQTLIFLHQQKFTLLAGQVQEGIIHGNRPLAGPSAYLVHRPRLSATDSQWMHTPGQSECTTRKTADAGYRTQGYLGLGIDRLGCRPFV